MHSDLFRRWRVCVGRTSQRRGSFGRGSELLPPRSLVDARSAALAEQVAIRCKPSHQTYTNGIPNINADPRSEVVHLACRHRPVGRSSCRSSAPCMPLDPAGLVSPRAQPYWTVVALLRWFSCLIAIGRTDLALPTVDDDDNDDDDDDDDDDEGRELCSSSVALFPSSSASDLLLFTVTAGPSVWS